MGITCGHGSAVHSTVLATQASPDPTPLSSWRLGCGLLHLPPLLFSPSTARKTPPPTSVSPPRVPRSTMSSTSTRYEPQCEKVLIGHTFIQPHPGDQGSREQLDAVLSSVSPAVHLLTDPFCLVSQPQLECFQWQHTH